MTQKGTILSGKKFEMRFEYIPETTGTHESFWKFKIPTEGIEQKFLVVGMVVEPNVVMEVGKVNFGPLLVGGKSKEIIKLVN
jgi:hydrocephalus-inducing protein